MTEEEGTVPGRFEMPRRDIAEDSKDFMRLDPTLKRLDGGEGSQIFVLREKENGGHDPIVIFYTSLYEIEDATDKILNFDPSQDKIDLTEIVLSLGADFNECDVYFKINNEGDADLIIEDHYQGALGVKHTIVTFAGLAKDKTPETQKMLLSTLLLK